ncbi:hypothetical protein C8255_08330 [filamentous cyanobacterium CCP3]|nr:hypothetical protein C8255_08330 [filamentous cyanobacterium CCP3]
MVSQEDIQKEIELIDEKWENLSARNGLFGNLLRSVSIANIRSIDETIEFTWPVTVIGGSNGSGKTTVLQICSTAYSQEKGGRYYKLGDWIRNALLGETPAVQGNADVSFSFWDGTSSFHVPYQPARTRWGYPRRGNPQRHTEFIGIANFAPRIEKKDRVHVFRAKLEIQASEEMDFDSIKRISKILGVGYSAVKIQKVGVPKGKWSDSFPQIQRGCNIYSEPHMGAGEQKVIRLVQYLEKLPKKSLILLEEPEITLHPDAQSGLAWYLMNLSRRQGHQIIVATHSPNLFETLPAQSRVLLIRDSNKVEVLHNASYLRVARELSGSIKTNHDIVFVEDPAAEIFLQEILRRCARKLFETSCIVPIGNTDDVYRMVSSFRKKGVRAVGVRDADTGGDKAQYLFSLPGNAFPEKLLLSSDNLVRAEKFVNGIQESFALAETQGLGRSGSDQVKEIFKALSKELGLDPEKLADRLILAWFSDEENSRKAKKLAEEIEVAFDDNP